MNEQLIEKAKEAKTVEDLLVLAKENDFPLDKEGAEEIFVQLHAEGELEDSELDSVSGGGCACYTKVGGHKYVIVTPHLQCFNGGFKRGFKVKRDFNGRGLTTTKTILLRSDKSGLRSFWLEPSGAIDNKICGNCYNLEFKGSTGYCGLS